MSYDPPASVNPVPIGQLLVTATSTLESANDAYWLPVYVPIPTTINRLGTYIDVSSGNLDLGLYTDNAGVPNSLIVGTGSVASPGTGKREFTVTETVLTPGVIWFASSINNTTLSRRYANLGTAGNVAMYQPDAATFYYPRRKSSSFPLPSTVTGTTMSNLSWLQWATYV